MLESSRPDLRLCGQPNGLFGSLQAGQLDPGLDGPLGLDRFARISERWSQYPKLLEYSRVAEIGGQVHESRATRGAGEQDLQARRILEDPSVDLAA